jgi:peptide/nickel transport system substrate-binding protein
MKKMLFVLIGIVLLFSLLLGACGKETPVTTKPAATTSSAITTAAPATTPAATSAPASTTPDADRYGGTFKIPLVIGPATPLGYPAEAAPDSTAVAVQTLETLIRVKMDGTIEPVLATSWKPANDNKSITVTLRKNVKFHDGSDFNAQVCKWNMDNLITAKRATDWQSIDVVDDYTIRVNIAGYKNTILTGLTNTQQISKASFDKNGIEYARWHPVGTGPFIFVEYQRDAKVTYKRNPAYWIPGRPYLDSVEYLVLTDSTVRKLAFQKKDLHLINTTGFGVDSQELQAGGYPVFTFPGGTFLLIPCSKATESPWSKVKVRQAAYYALNRESIAKALGYGFAKPAYQLYPNDVLSSIPGLSTNAYDKDKSKALLTEAGYPNGFQTKMYSFPQNISEDWASVIATQLTAVGIVTDSIMPTAGKYMEIAGGGWNDGILHAAFINSAGNPNSMLNLYFFGYFYPSIKPPDAMKAALDASMATPEPDAKMIQAVMKTLQDDMTVIPYLQETATLFIQKGTHYDAAKAYGWASFYCQDAWIDKSAR